MSSAYKARPVLGLIPAGKSLIKSTKRIGPKIEPCGTPERTGLIILRFKEAHDQSFVNVCSACVPLTHAARREQKHRLLKNAFCWIK